MADTSTVTLEDITLEDLKLPKKVISKLEDGTYHVDADELIEFYRSDRGQEHFSKMEQRLEDALDKKHEKRRDKLGEKYADAETDEDEERLEKEEEKIEDWYGQEGDKITARMVEINRVFDDLLDQSIGARGKANASGGLGSTLLKIASVIAVIALVFIYIRMSK